MKKESVWLNSVPPQKSFSKLDKDIKTNVLIIGGGITGILCAYELKKRNIDYVLVEKDQVGLKTSKDSTAFLSIHHETLYQDLIKNKGETIAKEYLDLNLKALNLYKELAKNYQFDYRECTSTLFTNKNPRIILKEVNALNKLGYDSKVVRNIPLNINIKAGITLEKQAMINPYKLILELSKELNIYEKTEIRKLYKNIAYNQNNNKIYFENVIIATHYPFKNISGLYFLKLIQKRSYVCNIKSNINFEGTYCSLDENGLYFRKYKDNIIIGGNDRYIKDKVNNDFLKKIIKLDIGKIENLWSGQDCITLDYIPYIGKYNCLKKNYYVATGFNFWGFTWAMASSFILADMIENKKQYNIFNMNNRIYNKNLINNIKTSLKNFITFKTPRCKHLGCKLNYNEIEKTWECPCHGSRYDEKGNVLDGPANKKIKI